MNLYEVAGIVTGSVLALAAVLGILWAVAKWFYSRGAEERELTVAVRENTKVTKDLSEHLTVFKESTVASINDLRLAQQGLAHQVATQEARLSGFLGGALSHGGTPAVPNPGTP